MAIYCDDCDEKIDCIDDANEEDGDILCDSCLADRDDAAVEDDEGNLLDHGATEPIVLPFCCSARRTSRACKHQRVQCAKCDRRIPECGLIDRQGPGKVCPLCAHRHELSIWTPEDHDATKCKLCTE